ncbi:MAG TPA: NTP transferase domain-containing protein, partial [Pyrinomonadaceae bacterium]|nr:NTP transferase domain-containing protein [Pyrinomonadaceae bacterium]
MDKQPPPNTQGTQGTPTSPATPTTVTNTTPATSATSAPLDVLILAAGLGTRMHSRTAKVLHQLGGRPLIAHVCHTAAAIVKEGRPVHIVVGHQAEEVKAAVAKELGAGGA